MSDLRELLFFYADSGADEALEDEPVNRLAPKRTAHAQPAEPAGGDRNAAAPSRPAAPAHSMPAAPHPPASPDMAAAIPDERQAERARELARNAGSLEELRALLAEFDGCNLKFTAKNLAFSDGDPTAKVMFVGEAPGRDEDIQGLPFVGRSGKLLDRMLAAIGLDRGKAYIANVIPWRPPGNRTPTPLETEICRPFIERQIELAAPKVLVTLGGPSAKALLRTQEGILRMRGTWRSHTTASGREIPAMPTLHPAYLLRNPAHKRLAWRDFLALKVKLRELDDDA